ncbi:MAG: sodium:calcium antiporter [Candidatus Cyclobacteriaceae bacterium M3_2C_046]
MNLTTSIIVFLIFTVVIAFGGTKLSKTADTLADITGIGEALFGAIMLGGITSLPGIVTSVTAAVSNHPELAVSNAIGGIAAQTAFLSIADIAYKRANLEHASASFPNLMQGVMLIILLSYILVVIFLPEVTVYGVHPASVLMLIIYVSGASLIAKAIKDPMWKPQDTKETIQDEPEDENLNKKNVKMIWLRFMVLSAVVAFSGYMVARSGINIAESTGLSESFVGSLFTAVATSLPELIVSISAVRHGALTLAVANIIGGNTFDVLFVAFADFGYVEGSIFHAITSSQEFLIALTMILTSVLLLGLLHRQKEGIARIGWESFMVIILYLLGNLYIFFDK